MADSSAEKPYTPAPVRFQIASRLGAFRDTATVADPFGTGATFTVYRNGSKAHKTWFSTRIDSDPMSIVMTEAMLRDSTVVLTPEETALVEGERAKAESPNPNPLLPVVDRLIFTRTEQELRREATKYLLHTGQLKPSLMARRGEEEMLEEALFVLRSWDRMPDADGGMVEFSAEVARELLTNDTPLEGAGIDELILGVDAWTIEIEHETEDGTEVVSGPVTERTFETYKVRHIIPGLTLGRAYQLYLLRRSRDLSLFRDQALDASAKNSLPSSDSTALSGDGTSATAS